MTSNLNRNKILTLSLDKILFTIACTYLMAVVFWLIGQGKIKLPGMTSPPESKTSQEKPLSAKDAQFIAYLQQSLDLLETKQKQVQPKVNSTPVQPVQKAVQVPLPPVPPTNLIVTAKNPQVIERIYIPVYPQQQTPVTVNPSISPQRAKVVKIPPPPPVTSVPVTPPSTVPVLTTGGNVMANTPPTTPTVNNMLVGLLEAGAQSSAIFTMNGTTQRVPLGEAIGSTGWTLQSVQGQQVTISRNGKTRYIGVGQGF